MDDGQYVQRGGLTLCTDSYSYDEVLLLKSILENKYDLNCSIHNKNNLYFRIYISGYSLSLLLKKYLNICTLLCNISLINK